MKQLLHMTLSQSRIDFKVPVTCLVVAYLHTRSEIYMEDKFLEIQLSKTMRLAVACSI